MIFSLIVVVFALIVASLIFRKRVLAAAPALILLFASLPVVADRMLLFL